jgi:hypothetical protein
VRRWLWSRDENLSGKASNLRTLPFSITEDVGSGKAFHPGIELLVLLIAPFACFLLEVTSLPDNPCRK